MMCYISRCLTVKMNGQIMVKSVRVIGDAQAPAPIAWATYAGHRYARELDEPVVQDTMPFRRELAQLAD